MKRFYCSILMVAIAVLHMSAQMLVASYNIRYKI